jgi:hypothetical protein
MTADVVIGIPARIDELVAPLEQLFETEFEERESEHYGGAYFLAELPPSEEIRLYVNDDPAQRREYPALLRLFSTPRQVDALVSQIRAAVHPGALLLRSR